MEKIYTTCSPCEGTGVEIIVTLSGELELTEEIVCRTCGGEGKISHLSLSDELVALLNNVVSELDYIHGKVTAIWNQVKPGN